MGLILAVGWLLPGLWGFVAEAADVADTTTFYDNSGIDGPRIVASLSAGQVVGNIAWPDWAPADLRERWVT